jgi:hypothetical protein
MRRRYRLVCPPVVVALLLAAACATVGTGDKVVVRAEDALTNGLTVYTEAMEYHFRNSTKESPAVYKAFEAFRVKFPVAWNAVDKAKRNYQKDRSAGTGSLDAALAELAQLTQDITPLIGKVNQ